MRGSHALSGSYGWVGRRVCGQSRVARACMGPSDAYLKSMAVLLCFVGTDA